MLELSPFLGDHGHQREPAFPTTSGMDNGGGGGSGSDDNEDDNDSSSSFSNFVPEIELKAFFFFNNSSMK